MQITHFRLDGMYSSPLHQILMQVGFFLKNTSKPTSLNADSETFTVNSGTFSKHCV